MLVTAEWFQPAALVFQVCDSLSPLLSQNGNQLELEIDSNMAELHSDPGKVQQIVTNLFSNACKFTQNGTIKVSAHMAANELIIAVADTGIGMTEEQQSRVFEAFIQAESTTSTEYGGTGLGLAIVKQFCEMLGGRISLRSAPGEGSSFTVALPADQGSDPATV
jgi:signal transduction histidine kinase